MRDKLQLWPKNGITQILQRLFYFYSSVCNALTAKMDGNAQFLCSLFPKESTRVPQQLLILEVLSKVTSQASLVNLQILVKSAFQDMLNPGMN